MRSRRVRRADMVGRIALGRIALVFGSLLVGLTLLELGCRVVRGPSWLVHWPNLVLQERISTRAQGVGRIVPDPQLGFVARPGFSGNGMSYDEHGWRVAPNPEGLALAEPPILVAGDSLAHGDEVDNAEAWPARLPLMLRRRVANVAMTAYGFDQIVLAAKNAFPSVRPAMIILSFTADDTRRNEMKRVWGAEKPYFQLVDGTLTLRNSPVPASPAPADTLDFWQWAFGWSALIDTVLRHQGWQYEWALDHERVLPRGEGEKLSCILLARLKDLGVPMLVVAEYNRYVFENEE